MSNAERKQQQWQELSERILRLLRRGRRGLRSLEARELSGLIDDYQHLTADLARARSLGAPPSTVDQLNRMAVAGHNLLYGYVRPQLRGERGLWIDAFARAVRSSPRAVLISAMALFGPAIIAYFAVQLHPIIGYDLVPPMFYEFDPARADNLHDIPQLARPVVSSAIIANNIQVTILAFALGMTAGIGTTILLVFNGIHIGSVAGWMTHHGQARALWGWIMPHGGTELLAICLSGAAGYLLAEAILAPGLLRRTTALKQIGVTALVIELGCMFMLLIAGLIEGFVSPSDIPYSARIMILVGSLLVWGSYLLLAGLRRAR